MAGKSELSGRLGRMVVRRLATKLSIIGNPPCAQAEISVEYSHRRAVWERFMRGKLASLVCGVALTGLATLSFCSSASAVVAISNNYYYDLYLSDNSGDYINLDLTTYGPAGPLPSDGASITALTGNADIDGTYYNASGPTSGANGNADNLLYSDSPFVDQYGIGFDLTRLGLDPPYQYDGAGLTCNGGDFGCPDFSPLNIQLTQTPLPATLPLFATGIGGMGLLGWRRKRKAKAAVA